MKMYTMLLALSVIPVSISAKNDISPSQAAAFFTMAHGAARKSPILGLGTIAIGYLMALKSDLLDNHFADPQSPVNKALELTGNAIVDFIQKSRNSAGIDKTIVATDTTTENTKDDQTDSFNTTELE